MGNASEAEASREVVNYSTQINAEHRASQESLTKGAAHAHACGTWLRKQKAALPHGQWLKWVEEHCEFSDQTARNYMNIAGLNPKRILDLTLNDALLLTLEDEATTHCADEVIKEWDQAEVNRRSKLSPEDRKEEDRREKAKREGGQ